MRITVEMKPEHHKALLALAADRGEEGLSSVLSEAIDGYLERTQSQRRKELLLLVGSLSAEDAKILRAASKALRKNWR